MLAAVRGGLLTGKLTDESRSNVDGRSISRCAWKLVYMVYISFPNALVGGLLSVGMTKYTGIQIHFKSYRWDGLLEGGDWKSSLRIFLGPFVAYVQLSRDDVLLGVCRKRLAS